MMSTSHKTGIVFMVVVVVVAVVIVIIIIKWAKAGGEANDYHLLQEQASLIIKICDGY